MYGWAPLALLGEEINRLNDPRTTETYSSVAQDETELNEMAIGSIDQSHGSSNDRQLHEREDAATSVAQPAGTYLGIWNIYATIPQFLASFIALMAFAILEPGKSTEMTQDSRGDSSHESEEPTRGLSGTAACLAIGGVCSFVAATLTFRLARDRR